MVRDPQSVLLVTPLDPTQNKFFDKFAPSRFHIMLFGAGHVGRALIRKLEDIDCKISWVDSRAEQFPSDLPSNTVRIISDQPEEVAAKAPANTYFLIMTHSHQIDQRVCEAVLTRNDFRLCGLIGSATKRRKFEDRLRAKGISDDVLDKLTCPIGISGITGKEPAVIAISVAAQLLGRAIWANQTA
jgi:xanthine dehydrogenase accessory factor